MSKNLVQDKNPHNLLQVLEMFTLLEKSLTASSNGQKVNTQQISSDHLQGQIKEEQPEEKHKKLTIKQIKEELKKLMKASTGYITGYIINKDHEKQENQVKIKEEISQFNEVIDLLIRNILSRKQEGLDKLSEESQFFWQSLLAYCRITACNYSFNDKNGDISVKNDISEQQTVATDGLVIALPYEPQPKSIPLPSTDITDAQAADPKSRGFDSKYYNEDDQKLPEYLQKKFKVVQREGVSQFATKYTEKICENLLEELLSRKICNIQTIHHIIQVLNELSISVYSLYLLNLFNKVVEKFIEILDNYKESGFMMTKQKAEKVIYGLASMAQRWASTENDNRAWEWNIKSKCILVLLDSKISQSKLAGVKMLIQIARKSIYTPTQYISPQIIKIFINQYNILEQIYDPDNHPEIISKGREVYEFLSRQQIIEERHMEILLRLLDKSHENVSKSLYVTIQNLGQKNLSFYCYKIFEKIVQLPRAACYCEQTLLLIETLMIIVPLSNLQSNLVNIYKIINKNYRKLKKHIKQKLIKLYFEVFVMGVEEGILYKGSENEDNQEKMEKEDEKQEEWVDMSFLDGIANSESTQIMSLMMKTFNQVTKNQVGKSVYNKCRRVLNLAICSLFTDFKIHLKALKQQQKKLFELLKFLLEIYQSNSIPLTYEQMCQLIECDISFAKFIQFYGQKQQMMVFDSLCAEISKRNEINAKQVSASNVIELASLMSLGLKQEIKSKLMQLFMKSEFTTQENEKLSKYLQKLYKFEIKQIMGEIDKLDCLNPNFQRKLYGHLLLIKQTIIEHDQKGFSTYLPFKYLFNSYPIQLKITNSLNVFQPIQWPIEIMSYQTVIEAISKLMKHFKIQKLSGIKIKVNNEKYLGVNDFNSTFDEFIKRYPSYDSSNTEKKVIKMVLFESYESSWFDKCQLINSDNVLHEYVIVALKEIFTQFTVGGRMTKQNCAHVFQKATNTEKILPTDSRIQYIYAYFSNNGQFLTIEDWLNFYQKSGEDNPGLVIDNLKKLGYSSLFKDEDLFEQFNSQGENTAREFISEKQGQKIYSYLFKKYQSQQLTKQTISLLQLLPLLPEITSLTESDLLSKYLNEKLKPQKMQKSEQDDEKWKWYILSFVSLQLKLQKQEENTVDMEKKVSVESEQHVVKLPSIDIGEIICSLIDVYEKQSQNTAIISSLKTQYLGYLCVVLKKVLECLEIENLEQISLATSEINKNEQPLTLQLLQKLPSLTQSQQKILQKIKNYQNFEKLTNYQTLLQICERYQNDTDLIDYFVKLYLLFIKAYFLKYKKLPQSVENTVKIEHELIFHKIGRLRRIFNNFYYLLSQICPSVKQQYYQINISAENSKIKSEEGTDLYEVKFTDKNKEEKIILVEHCSEFFDILAKILQGESSENEENICRKVTENIQQSIQKIANPMNFYLPMITYNSESITHLQRRDSSLKEQLILGQLTLLDSIKVYHPQMKISSPQSWLPVLLQQPLSSKTKQVIYRISNKLCSVDYNLNLLKQMMDGIVLHKNSFKIRKAHEKMGLYNLGCTCYINSTIQQLFMIEPFRKGIIAFEQRLKNLEMTEYDLMEQTKNQKQKYFGEFQKMIYFLAFSRRQFFIPDQFCLTYTDYNNQPINIKQQHDADQFLNSLFDRLEHTLSDNPDSNTIHDNFRGKIANIIHCQSCFSHRVKLEDFYVLSVEIKNHKNLSECIQKIAQPQIITDYYCQHCDKKVQCIHKYHKLHQLPKYLFIHFQRLIFDLETLTKIKLEQKIEYQQEIDFEEFMFNEADNEGNDSGNIYGVTNGKNETRYRIRGFIVHVGTSESGHYYSLVREGNNWIKFDDSRVSYWNWADSPAEREGAYMLIYEKISTEEQQAIVPKMEIGNKQLYQAVTQDNINLIKQTTFLQKSFTSHLLQTLSRIEIPHEFIQSISGSPNKLQIPYHPQYQLLPSIAREHLQQAHTIILNFLRLVAEVRNLGISANAYEYNENFVRNSVCYLIMIYHLCPKMIYEGLEFLYGKSQNNSVYFRYISTHPDKLIRQSYKLIFIKILSILCSALSANNTSSSLYLIPAPENSDLKHVQNIMQQGLGMLPDVGRNYTKMQEYFEFMAVTVQISEGCTEWLQVNNFGPKLIHFLLQDSSPLKSKLPVYSCSISSISKKQNFINSTIRLISKLIMKHYQSSSKHQPENEELAKIGYFSKKWIEFIHQERCEYQQAHKAFMIVMKHEIEKDVLFDEDSLEWYFCRYSLQKINRYSHDDSYIMAYIHLLQQLLVTQISIPYEIKLQWLLGVPIFTAVQNQQIVYSHYKPSFRFYKYTNPISESTDQIILPFLQILYINRYHINYFTLVSNATLLWILINQPKIRQYMLKMPTAEPSQNQFYYEWINGILDKAMKDEANFGSLDKKKIINEIAASLNCLDVIVKGDGLRKLSNGSDSDKDHENSPRMKSQQKNQQILSAKKVTQVNPINKIYQLDGMITKIKDFPILKVHPHIKLKIQELKDRQETRILQLNLEKDEQEVDKISKVWIRFSWEVFPYAFYLKNLNSPFTMTIPYPNELLLIKQFDGLGEEDSLLMLTEFFQQYIKVDAECNYKEEPKQQENANKPEQGSAPIVMGDTSSNKHPQNDEIIIECPFCMNISYGFVSKCPSCGQEWGAYM